MKPTGSISTRTSNTKHSGMTKSFWQQWNLWIVSASSTQSLTGSISLCAVPVPNKNVAVLECTSLKWRPLKETMWSIIGTGISQLPAVCSEHSISGGISKNCLSPLVYIFQGGKENLDHQTRIPCMEKILFSTNVLGSTGPSSCTQSDEIQSLGQFSLLSMETSNSHSLSNQNTARRYVVNMDIYLSRAIGKILEPLNIEH